MNADLFPNWNNSCNCMLKLDDTFSFLYAFSFNRGESMTNVELFIRVLLFFWCLVLLLFSFFSFFRLFFLETVLFIQMHFIVDAPKYHDSVYQLVSMLNRVIFIDLDEFDSYYLHMFSKTITSSI